MLKKYILFSIFLLLFFSCGEKNNEFPKENKENQQTTLKIEKETKVTETEKPISKIEKSLLRQGLVNIQKIDSTIQVDVRYATPHNFMGIILYENYDKVYLQPVIAERLAKVQKELKAINPFYSLKVFDGARPRFVQQQMWDALDTLPLSERTKFLSNPANGSLHNYGCAVDLTIINTKTGQELDMGASYDDLRKIAYPRHEEYYLQLGELTETQISNRELLREVMKTGGFWVIQTEWWHFNGYSREKAKSLYEIIE